MSSIEKWQLSKEKTVFTARIFTVESHIAKNPRNNIEAEYFTLKFPDFVNVIAVTEDKNVVLIKQFKHGSKEIEIEVPGGCIDHGECPLEAGVRELAEETGYTGGKPQLIGTNLPNPAIQGNRCYTVLIENCHLSKARELDEGEDIEVFKIPLKDVKDMIINGKISNAMVIAAFYCLQNNS